MPNATGKKRLLKLAEMLEEDAANRKGLKFNLNVVVEPAGTTENLFREELPEGYVPGLDCGTEACAMGLAAISGEFKRSGLTYAIEDDEIIIILHGEDKSYQDAAMFFFDLSHEEAQWLFDPQTYEDKDGEPAYVKASKGERRVAKRIRSMVAGKAEIYNYQK